MGDNAAVVPALMLLPSPSSSSTRILRREGERQNSGNDARDDGDAEAASNALLQACAHCSNKENERVVFKNYRFC